MPFLRANVLMGLLTISISCIVHATTITFYAVAPTTTREAPFPTPSYSYSLHAIGVGADGATTYAEEVIWSESVSFGRTVYTSGGMTVTTTVPVATITGEPVTGTAIIVADATHYLYSTFVYPLQEDVVQECAVGTATMSCELRVSKSGSGSRRTSTVVGPAVPFYTLVTSGGHGTQDSAAISRVFQFLVPGVVVVLGGLVGFFRVI